MWWQEQRRDGALWRTLWPRNEDAMGDKTVAGRSSRRPRVACDPPRSASPVAAAVALGQRSLVAVYHLHTGSHASVHTLGNAAPGASQEHHKSVVSPVVDGSFSVRALPQPPMQPPLGTPYHLASRRSRTAPTLHRLPALPLPYTPADPEFRPTTDPPLTFPAPRPPHESIPPQSPTLPQPVI